MRSPILTISLKKQSHCVSHTIKQKVNCFKRAHLRSQCPPTASHRAERNL